MLQLCIKQLELKGRRPGMHLVSLSKKRFQFPRVCGIILLAPKPKPSAQRAVEAGEYNSLRVADAGLLWR